MTKKKKKKPKRLRREDHPTPDLGNVIRMKIDNKFGMISDTHFGALGEGIKQLESMYDDFVDAGVTQVFHGGDLVDGERVYRGHNRYLKIHGFQSQAIHTINNFPERDGITTHIIAGNHDLSFYLASGADIVDYICHNREDLEYSGMYYARFQEGRFKLDMLHPSGGGFYSKSYGIQKWIRENELPSTYADIMGFGHWHRHGYFEDHEIECIMAGGFQSPNEYHIRRGLVGEMGGWIIELDREKSRLYGIKLEWRGKKK